MAALLAVDPSLTASGWALFSVESGELKEYGVMSPPPPSVPLATRLRSLQSDIQALFMRLEFGERDVLVCEGPAPLVLNPESAMRVEQVRSIFEATARALGMEVPGRINPRTVQSEILGMRGKQLARKLVKESAKVTFHRIFGEHPGIRQDAIDAALVGLVALSRVQLATAGSIPLVDVFGPKFAESLPSRRSRYAGWSGRAAQKLIRTKAR